MAIPPDRHSLPHQTLDVIASLHNPNLFLDIESITPPLFKNIHANPSLAQFHDGLYITTKKVKSNNDVGFLPTSSGNKENDIKFFNVMPQFLPPQNFHPVDSLLIQNPYSYNWVGGLNLNLPSLLWLLEREKCFPPSRLFPPNLDQTILNKQALESKNEAEISSNNTNKQIRRQKEPIELITISEDEDEGEVENTREGINQGKNTLNNSNEISSGTKSIYGSPLSDQNLEIKPRADQFYLNYTSTSDKEGHNAQVNEKLSAERLLVSQTEPEKPNESFLKIESNMRMNVKDAEDESKMTNKIFVGPNHQAELPLFKLNKKRQHSKILKPIWSPAMLGDNIFGQFLKDIECVLGQSISNEEKAAKLLVKFELSPDDAVAHVEKNRSFYNNYFSSNQRILRKRQSVV